MALKLPPPPWRWSCPCSWWSSPPCAPHTMHRMRLAGHGTHVASGYSCGSRWTAHRSQWPVQWRLWLLPPRRTSKYGQASAICDDRWQWWVRVSLLGSQDSCTSCERCRTSHFLLLWLSCHWSHAASSETSSGMPQPQIMYITPSIWFYDATFATKKSKILNLLIDTCIGTNYCVVLTFNSIDDGCVFPQDV